MAALWDEFPAAVRVLVGTGPIKQRLLDAYRHHLASVHEQDLPEPVQARFAALKSVMHEARNTCGLTAPEASVRKMSDRDAVDQALAIFEMYAVLATSNETAPRLRIVSNDVEDELTDDLFEIPAFLSRA